jgi:hypothetical protein
MLNRNDYPIGTNVIPSNLKCAQAEYARLLADNDLTASSAASSASAAGISSVSAAGVSVSFKSSTSSSSSSGIPGPDTTKTYGKEGELHAQVPSSVIMLLVPSWLLDPRDKDAEFTGLLVEVL